MYTKLSHWATENGIHYRTALRMFHDGRLPVPAIQIARDGDGKGGTILVQDVSHSHVLNLARRLPRPDQLLLAKTLIEKEE